MENKMKIWFIGSLVIIFLLNSCNQSSEFLVYNPELVFTNALKIDVAPYSYSNLDSTEIFNILGDSTLDADTVDSTPVFQWTNVLTSLLTVAISKEAFVVSGDRIINTDQIIWQWQPGMEKGDYGNVAYLDGKSVENQEIIYNKQPLPLESGLYYWAVWGWENSGRVIIYSTQCNKIYVK
jgi:hypothetical protein